MDVSELANQQIELLSQDPRPERVAFTTAMALWQIVKVLNRIEEAMPHKTEL